MNTRVSIGQFRRPRRLSLRGLMVGVGEPTP
jgi:hypothetical protein